MKFLTLLFLTLQVAISTADDTAPSAAPRPDPPDNDNCIIKGWTKNKCKKEKCCTWKKVPSKITPNCYPKAGCILEDEGTYEDFINEHEEDILEDTTEEEIAQA